MYHQFNDGFIVLWNQYFEFLPDTFPAGDIDCDITRIKKCFKTMRSGASSGKIHYHMECQKIFLILESLTNLKVNLHIFSSEPILFSCKNFNQFSKA